MPNVIKVKAKQEVRIKRDGKGAVIRITNAAADILENFLNEGGEELIKNMSVCQLASNFIEYAAKDTIIEFEREGEVTE